MTLLRANYLPNELVDITAVLDDLWQETGLSR